MPFYPKSHFSLLFSNFSTFYLNFQKKRNGFSLTPILIQIFFIDRAQGIKANNMHLLTKLREISQGKHSKYGQHKLNKRNGGFLGHHLNDFKHLGKRPSSEQPFQSLTAISKPDWHTMSTTMQQDGGANHNLGTAGKESTQAATNGDFFNQTGGERGESQEDVYGSVDPQSTNLRSRKL